MKKAIVCLWAMAVGLGGGDLVSPAAAQEFEPGPVGRRRIAEKAQDFAGDSLFGYIDGGAELFLQYGFKGLRVFRYTNTSAPEKEITLEAYLMASPADAFGIFSVRREGSEEVSARISALHWISPTQANLAEGRYFMDLSGVGTSQKDLEEFTASFAESINAPSEPPPELDRLPVLGRIERTERYIRGKLAAEEESPLLGQEFWGFAAGTTAVSAKYRPARALVIVVALKDAVANLEEKVAATFEEYLEGVSSEGGTVAGRNSIGRHFLFRAGEGGRRAVLVLGEADLARAKELLKEAETLSKRSKNLTDRAI